MEWQAFTQRYFLERPTLVAVLLLVDASIPPQPADLDAADWLGTAEVTCLRDSTTHIWQQHQHRALVSPREVHVIESDALH